MRGPSIARVLVLPSLLLLLCAAAAGCNQGSGRAATTEPDDAETTRSAGAAPSAGQLAFEVATGVGQYSNGHGSIWVVNTDGSGRRQLADAEWTNRLEHPGWSPDGAQIAFHSGTYHWGTGWLALHSVWVMERDGTRKTQLTDLPEGCLWPTWSPDGTRIAFSAYSPRTTEVHIAVMGADGSHVTTLTTARAFDAFPAWTPDGRIMFLRKPYAKPKSPGDLYVVSAEGTGLVRITQSGNVGGFGLSPDGTKIAFHDAVVDQIKLMPADAATPPSLLVDDDFGWISAAITWAPDGRALAIGCSSLEAASGDEVYIVNVDGSNLHAVPGIENGLDPAWRPR